MRESGGWPRRNYASELIFFCIASLPPECCCGLFGLFGLFGLAWPSWTAMPSIGLSDCKRAMPAAWRPGPAGYSTKSSLLLQRPLRTVAQR